MEPSAAVPKPRFPLCEPPREVVCVGTSEGPTQCSCAAVPPPPRDCIVTITYRDSDPAQPIAVTDPACDQVGIELAIAVVLARLLGAKP
jgi:hypothetical protein